MNINHNNYEECFILYMDNELSVEESRKVEDFIQQFPELKEELNILLQSRLVADKNVVFENKEELLNISQASNINITNFEEWFILYFDNELSASEISAVETFVSQNPEMKKELEYFWKAKLQPETEIIFPDKKSLYRREEKVPIIPIRWRRIAVAALLILATGITAIVLINNKSASNELGIATGNGQNPTLENPVVNESKKQEKIIADKNKANQIAVIKHPVENNAVQKTVPANQKKKNELPVQKKIDENNMIANNQKPTNNLPVPDINVNRPENIKNVTNVIKNEKTLTPQNKPELAVTTQVTDTYITYTSAKQNQTDVIYASETNESKNKLRGFFRKVTRVFERTTNIDVSDDDDRLLIGGLSVKLK